MLPWDENFDIGADTGTPVDDPGLPGAVRLHRTIDKPTFALKPPKLTAEDEKRLLEEKGKASDQ